VSVRILQVTTAVHAAMLLNSAPPEVEKTKFRQHHLFVPVNQLRFNPNKHDSRTPYTYLLAFTNCEEAVVAS